MNFLNFLSKGGSAISSVLTNAANIALNSINNRNVANLAQLQNSWNMAQWDRQNEYDSPASQMQRFMDAGLNPNLVYSQMSSGTPAQSMQSGYENQNPSHVFDSLSEQMQLQMQKKQLELMESKVNTENKKTEADTLKSLADVGFTQAGIKLLEEQTNEVKAKIENIRLDSMNKSYENRLKIYDWMIKSATWKNSVQESANRLKVSFAEANYSMELMAARVLNLNNQADKLESDIQVNRSQIYKNNADARMASALGAYYGSLSKLNDLEYEKQTYKTANGFYGYSTNGNPIYEEKAIPYWKFKLKQDLMYSGFQMSIPTIALEFSRKYGDAEHILNIFQLGTSSLDNVSRALSRFLPWSSSSVEHQYPNGDVGRNFRGRRGFGL